MNAVAQAYTSALTHLRRRFGVLEANVAEVQAERDVVKTCIDALETLLNESARVVGEACPVDLGEPTSDETLADPSAGPRYRRPRGKGRHEALRADILAALVGGPKRPGAVTEAVQGDRLAVRKVINELIDEGLVEATGTRVSRRWSLVVKPQADAPRQAARADQDGEVVWNGETSRKTGLRPDGRPAVDEASIVLERRSVPFNR